MTDQKQKRDNVRFYMNVVVLPILGLLLASEGWQYYKAPSKIQEDTKVHSKKEFNQNVDSLRKVIANEEFVKGVFSAGASKYKDLEGEKLDKYLIDVFKLADKGLKNDSIWSNVQLPFIVRMIEHEEDLEFLFTYDFLIPLRHKEGQTLHFNWLTGVRDMYQQPVNGGVIRGVIDPQGDKHPIQVLSTIKDN